MKLLSTRIDDKLAERIKILAIKKGITLQELIKQIVEDYLKVVK